MKRNSRYTYLVEKYYPIFIHNPNPTTYQVPVEIAEFLKDMSQIGMEHYNQIVADMKFLRDHPNRMSLLYRNKYKDLCLKLEHRDIRLTGQLFPNIYLTRA